MIPAIIIHFGKDIAEKKYFYCIIWCLFGLIVDYLKLAKIRIC